MTANTLDIYIIGWHEGSPIELEHLYGASAEATDSEDPINPPIDNCVLCEHHHDFMSDVSTWTNTDASSFAKEMSMDDGDCICCPCRDDVCRCLKNPSYIPRWEKRTRQISCCILHCSTLSMCKLYNTLETPMTAIEQCIERCKSDASLWESNATSEN